MCIFIEPIAHVFQTILITILLQQSHHNSNGILQIYSNSIELNNNNTTNAMIIPVRTNSSIMLLNNDMNWIENVIKQTMSARDRFVNEYEPYSIEDQIKTILMSSEIKEYLNIIKTDTHYISIAHNLDELELINPKYFHLSNITKHIMKQHYNDGTFQFLIVRLLPGETYKPFAYFYNIVPSQQYFLEILVPTRHLHGLEYSHHEYNWDHSIYFIGFPQHGYKSYTIKYNESYTQSFHQYYDPILFSNIQNQYVQFSFLPDNYYIQQTSLSEIHIFNVLKDKQLRCDENIIRDTNDTIYQNCKLIHDIDPIVNGDVYYRSVYNKSMLNITNHYYYNNLDKLISM